LILAHLIHRIATDPTFAVTFIDEPQTALEGAGLAYDDEVVAAVMVVLRDRSDWKRLCSPAMDGPEEPLPWWSGIQPVQ
jgi:hypothetical protein